MIAVKSCMCKMPKSCNKCVYYSSEGKRYSDPDRICYGTGRGFLLNKDTRVTVERSKVCPLIVVQL